MPPSCAGSALVVARRRLRAARHRARSRPRPGRTPAAARARRPALAPAAARSTSTRAAVAVFGLRLVFVARLPRSRAERDAPRLFALRRSAVLALLLVQMAVGEIQYRTHLPWRLVLVHVGARGGGLGDARRLRHGSVASAAGARSGPHVDWNRWPTSFASHRRPELDAAGPDRRLPRLERRRPGRLARGRLPRQDLGGASGSPRSTRRSSSTSRRRGRTSRSRRG